MLNYLVRRSLRPRYSKIASKIHVANEWLEFPCVKPARPHGCSQHISLISPGYEFDLLQDNFVIQLPNGRVVRPMIEVVNAHGNTFVTEDSSRAGNLIGFRVKQCEALGTSLGDDLQQRYRKNTQR